MGAVFLSAAAIYFATQATRTAVVDAKSSLTTPAPRFSPANPNAGLLIDAADLDWDEVWERDYLGRELTIRNSSKENISITGWAYPCGFNIGPDSLIVPAGGEAIISLRILMTYDPSRLEPDLQIRKRFRPIIDGSNEDHPGWTVSVRSLRGFAMRDFCLKLADQALRRSVEFPIGTMDVLALRPIRHLDAGFDPSTLSVEIAGPDSQQQYAVRVQPVQELAPGSYYPHVTVRSLLENGETTESSFSVTFEIE